MTFNVPYFDWNYPFSYHTDDSAKTGVFSTVVITGIFLKAVKTVEMFEKAYLYFFLGMYHIGGCTFTVAWWCMSTPFSRHAILYNRSPTPCYWNSTRNYQTGQYQFCSLLMLNVSFQQGNKSSISLKIQSKSFKEKAEINLSEFFFCLCNFCKTF